MTGFSPPPYPYDRLKQFVAFADRFDGGLLDFSVGTPGDDPAPAVQQALAEGRDARGYPPSAGTEALREAAVAWLDRRVGVSVGRDQVAATVGSKEFVTTLPQWMKLRSPHLDTVLFPATSYPSYAMGATLAGCRAVAVPERADGSMALDAVAASDIERTLLLWVNSPANPTGRLADLAAIAEWGREHGVPVFSDECYLDFTWDGPPRSMLQSGVEGVVSVFSLSKRSNLAGARIGYYAGDGDLVAYLREVRKHVGMMAAGPCQAAAVVALDDDASVQRQRERYVERLAVLAETLTTWTGLACPLPAGGFYLWMPVGDAWAFVERLASEAAALVAPGEFFGPAGAGHVRVAAVQPVEQVELLKRRLGQT